MSETVEERLNQISAIAKPIITGSGMQIESLIEHKQSVGGELFVLFILTSHEKVACVYVDYHSKIAYKGRCYDQNMVNTFSKAVIPEDKYLEQNDEMAVDDLIFALKQKIFKEKKGA